MAKKNIGLTQGEQEFVEALLDLPHKIICHQHIDNLAHAVLHDIARPSSFGLRKAAYLVDNPDFDCLTGVAGYSSEEYTAANKANLDHIWDNPQEFLHNIGQTPFHERVKNFSACSLRLRDKSADREAAINEIARALGIQNPVVIDWDMRHENHGVLIFEQTEKVQHKQTLLASVAAFLGLCAI